MLLVVSSTFSGCWYHVEVPVYIEASCPSIEVLSRVNDMNGSVELDGSLSPVNTRLLINTAKALRRSESYYVTEITKYNKDFVDNDD